MPRNWNDDYWDLVSTIVPDEGEADTEQGELVRAVLRLTAECSRNGCGNWDDYFENLVDFALTRFNDGSLDDEVANTAREVIARLCKYGRTLRTTEEQDHDVYLKLCDDIDAPLEAAAVQWCQRQAEPIPYSGLNK